MQTFIESLCATPSRSSWPTRSARRSCRIGPASGRECPTPAAAFSPRCSRAARPSASRTPPANRGAEGGEHERWPRRRAPRLLRPGRTVCWTSVHYRWDAARPALEALGSGGVPLLLCSSKTRAEMEALARGLGLAGPLIVENGGALVLPKGRADGAGVRREDARLARRARAPRQAPDAGHGGDRAETGVAATRLRGTARVRDRGPVPASSGLVELARRREWDAPFLVEARRAGRARWWRGRGAPRGLA